MPPRVPSDTPGTARDTARGHRQFLGLTAIALVVLLCARVLPFGGSGDVDIWLGWMETIGHEGTAGAYDVAHRDYPPGAFAVLTATEHVTTTFGIDPLLALKTTIALFAFVGAGIFAAWTRSAWQTAAFLLAILLNGAALGYLDSLIVPPLLLSLMALQRRRVTLAAFFYAMAMSLKWQPLIVAPFFLVEACEISWPFRPRVWLQGLARLALGVMPVAVALLVAFNLPTIAIALRAALSHNQLSFQGLNVNWIVQVALYAVRGASGALFDLDAPRWISTVARIGFDSTYLLVLLAFIFRRERTYQDFVWFACVGFYTYCVLCLGVHENHPFDAMILAFALLPLRHSAARSMALYLAVATNLNLLIFDGIDGHVRMDEKMPFANYWSVIVPSVIISAANAIWWARRFKEGVFPLFRRASGLRSGQTDTFKQLTPAT